MQANVVNLLNTAQIKEYSTSFQNHNRALMSKKLFIPAFIPFMIPGFGPFVIEVIALPTIIEGLTIALSRGANKSRLQEINNLPKPFTCYQCHPETAHQHTVSLDDLPYPRKLKIANAANNVFNAFGEIIFSDKQTFCKKYIEARDHFYNTINQEYKDCKKDYYNIVARDAMRAAWFKCDFDHDTNQALEQIEDAIHIIKSSTNILYNRLPVDLITAKIALHYIAGEFDLAMESLNKLINDCFAPSEFSSEQRSFVSRQLHALAVEGHLQRGDLDLEDPLSLMTEIGLRYLSVYHYRNTLQGGFHVGKLLVELLKALHDNLKLIKKNENWDILPHALAAGLDPKDFSSINLKVLKGLIQDFTPSALQTDDLTELFNYNYNCSKIFMNCKVFEFCIKNIDPSFIPKQQKIQESLKQAALDNQAPTLYHIKDEPNCSHEVVIFETLNLHVEDSISYFSDLKEKANHPNISVIQHYYKSSKNFFYPSVDQEEKNQQAIDMLYEEITRKLNQSKCQKLTLSCHSYGLEIIEKVLKMLPLQLLNKIELAVFSPTIFAEDLKGVKIVYYQDIQDTFSELAINASLNQEQPQLYFLNEVGDSKDKSIQLDLVYKKMLISLLA